MMGMTTRLAILFVGLVLGALGAYGAYEYAQGLEGKVTYLVLAAPVIAVMAAFIPPIAEATWRKGQPLKAYLWWAALVPAAAVVFFSAAERTHHAKSGAEAERFAHVLQATRAEAALASAQSELTKAEAEDSKATAQKQCGPQCRAKQAAAKTAKANVAAAKGELLSAQKQARTESPLQAPVWLLPCAIDVVAFMAIWTGLSGWHAKAPAKAASRATTKTKRTKSTASPRVTKKEKARLEAERLFRTGNVLKFGRA
ncbi:MAG: hypothetical protein EHM35_19210 [Planctomycetaceae bacterium]|nr:MAG: hypothetical protein EHM35_19210 [Planctomycetaceae bacterium]